MKRKLLSAALIGAMLVTSVPAFAANENTGRRNLSAIHRCCRRRLVL